MRPFKGTTGQSGTLLLIVLCAMTALICCGSDNPAKAGGPVITVQPQPQTVNEGDSVVLSVTATGNDLDYQWQVDTVDIPGAFEPSYVIDSATAGCAGTYRVIVANSQGTVISNSVKLTVKPWVRFSLSSQSAMENEGSITVTAELSSACDTAVSVPFIVSGTALRGTDYTISSSPLTIPKDSLSAAITIAITDDSLYENDETVIVTMGAPVNAARGNTTVDTVTILNDDPVPSIPTVQFTQAGQSASEGAGTMTITVQLSRSYYLPVTVPFTVSGTALQAADYTITPSPLTIPADSLSARIVIAVIDDNEIENDESVVVTLGTPTNATRGTISIHTATIIDNDTTAIYAVEGNKIILITPKSITSFCSGSTLHADTMRVSRDTLQFSLSNDTLRLTINGTVDTLTLVRVGAGSGIQGQWRMTNVSYETIIEFGPSTFTTSICNADVFMQSQAPSLEANYYISAARLSCNSVLLTGNSTGEKVTITYTPLPNNPFGIYADETYSSDNPLHSPPGTVYANPASCPNTAPAWYTTFLTENMTAPTVRFTGGGQIVSEGAGTVTVTARLSAPSAVPVTVPFGILGLGTATPDSDFTISPSPLIIPPDSLSATITVSIIDDNIVEDSEFVIIGMGTPINAVAGDTILHIIVIVDNEPPRPTVQFTQASQSAAEGAGTMTITVQLSKSYYLPVTMPFTVTGTALRDSDYTITPSPLVIPAGSLSAAITITMTDDTIFEKNETVVVTMGTPVNAKRGTTTVHTATITNDDPSPYYGTFSFLNPHGSLIWNTFNNYAVQWQTTGSPGQNAVLELYRDTTFYLSITPATPAGTGSFTWDIPDTVAFSSAYRIKITSLYDDALYAFSDSFTIIGLYADPYENDNTRASAKAAASGVLQPHTLTVRDTDWVRFTADSGTTFVIVDSGTNAFMTYVSIYYESETSYREYEFTNSWGYLKLIYTCPKSGTYYLKIYPYSNGGTGFYNLRVTEVDPYTTASFSNPTASSVWACNSTYTITWTPDTALFGSYIDLYLYKGDKRLAPIYQYGTANDGSYTFTVPPGVVTGADYRIMMENNSTNTIYGYSEAFTINGMTADAYEFDGSRDSAKQVELGIVQQHTITYSDTDWVKFTAESGSTYVFSAITGASDTTMVYFYLYFGTETSYTYAALSNSDGAFTYTWQCTRSGTWYVRMTPYNDNQHFGGYSFRMIKMDPAANTFITPAAGAVLTMGTSSPVTWTAETAIFSDSVSLYLYKGGRYYTGITATLNDGSFDWTPAQGIATGSDYTLRLSNTTYSPICFFGPQITINGWNPDVYENDSARALAKTAAPGDTQLHTITLHDTDWVKFTLDSGSTYTISVTPGAHGTNPTRVDLYLYYGTETSSTYSTTASDSGVINYTWTCTRSGTWYVRMNHDDNWFGYTYYGEYFFTVTKL